MDEKKIQAVIPMIPFLAFSVLLGLFVKQRSVNCNAHISIPEALGKPILIDATIAAHAMRENHYAILEYVGKFPRFPVLR